MTDKIFTKIKIGIKRNPLITQIMFVIIAFALMVISSYIVRRSMVQDTGEVLNYTIFISVLGAILAAMLCLILVKINKLRKKSEERMKAMFNAMPICANYWNGDFKNIDTNQEAVRLFDLSSKQEYLERFDELSPEYQPCGRHSKEKGQEYIHKAFEEGYCRFEWMHQNLKGEKIPCEITLVRIAHEGGYVVTGYTRDLRENLALQAEKERVKIAEASSKAKSSFLAKVSHEVRTPLNAILGITEIQLQNPKLSYEMHEPLEKIYDAGYLLLNIINDILDLSKIEAGMLELTPVKYDVPSLITDTVHLNVVLYTSKPVEFYIDIDENIPSMLYGDQLRIKQIMNNLLSNAFKFTYSGEIKMSITSEHQQDDKIILIIRVSDTGLGMTKEQVDVLFDEYTRFNLEANRNTVGSGLGMNITKHLVTMMCGEIFVESEIDKGSTFTVHLPQAKAADSVLGKKTAENIMRLHYEKSPHLKKNPQITRDYMPYGRVMIVDDVDTNLYVSRGLMSPYGLSVDTAINGYEVIEKIKKGSSYDIIFMDHFMPQLDGIETVKIIRNMGYDKPIIALTADAITGQAEMFMANGFDGFISKPVDIRQLNAVLNSQIRDKYSPEVVEAARKLKNDQIKFADNKKKQLHAHRQVLEIFLRDAEKAVNILEDINNNNYRRNNDIRMYITTIHSFKTMLAHVGEQEVSAAAFELEKTSREGKVDMLTSGTEEFLDKVKPVIEKIKKILSEGIKENNHDKISQTKLSFLRQQLSVIKSAVSEYNTKTAEDVLSQLRTETWPQDIQNLLNAVSGCLLHSDFDEVQKTLADFLNRE